MLRIDYFLALQSPYVYLAGQHPWEIAARHGAELVLRPLDVAQLFPRLAPGTNARAAARGAVYYPMSAPDGAEAARFVASWSTTPEDVEALIAALRP